MSASTATTKSSPKNTVKKIVLGVFIFCLFFVLQTPASLIVKKIMPQQTAIQFVQGSIWQGYALYQYQGISGQVQWQWRAQDLLKLQLGYNLKINMADSQLQGRVAKSAFGQIQLSQWAGQLTANTLHSFNHWDWPSNPIILRNINLAYKTGEFKEASGQLLWAGGPMNATVQGQVMRITVPALNGQLLLEDKKLKLAVTSPDKQKMANFYLTPDGMFEAQVTQRLLMSVPKYQGQAAPDTMVISLRQPVQSLGGL